MKDLLAALVRVEGEKQLDDGRGPWSQIIFDEIARKDDIARAGWEGLLLHCGALQQTVPGAKWKKCSKELIEALGEQETRETLLRWLALGPTPGQPSEARSPIEDSDYQKGVVWALSADARPEVAAVIGGFGVACLRKVPLLGAVSQKVGFACVLSLGAMPCLEAISQLTRLRSKVKYTVAQRLITKCLLQAAEHNGVTVDEIEDFAVPAPALDAEGKLEIAVGDALAILRLNGEGHTSVIWRNAEGKLAKSASPRIRKVFAAEVKAVGTTAKEIQQAYLAQRYRLEESFIQVRTMPLAHWRRYFVDQSLLGFLGRRLIWVFSDEKGWQGAGHVENGGVRGADGEVIDVEKTTKVRLWHPLAASEAERNAWRERIFRTGIRQPFRQAFREFYEQTEDERQTKTYSHRLAGILMHQHQFANLCRARGWAYKLMGAGFDGGNVPHKALSAWNMSVEFYVDLPSDRGRALLDSALAETSGAGINRFLGSDQVRFYRAGREIALSDVPAIVYSEVMRDVDLFTSVCAVGMDETWHDSGDRGMGIFTNERNIDELKALIALRLDVLSRVLPLTPVADRCRIDKNYLEVQGQLGTYRVVIAWGGVSRVTDKGQRFLNIPRKLLEDVRFDPSAFPIEIDHRTEVILRRAYLLADDGRIDSPELIEQL